MKTSVMKTSYGFHQPMMRPFIVSLALCVLLPGLATSALAQTRSDRDMAQRIQRLERDIKDLERDYYGKAAGGVAQAPGAPTPESATARMGVRLDQIEGSMRSLTGQIEELSHQLRQTQDQLNKLSADFDFSRTGVMPPAPGAAAPSYPSQPAPRLAPLSTGPRSLDPGPFNSAGNSAATTSVGDLAPGETSLGSVSSTAVDAMAARAAQTQPQNPSLAQATPQAGAPGSAVNAARQAMVSSGAQQQYDFAMAQLRRGDYPAAEAGFSQVITQYPDSPLAGNAQYWLGESFYVRQIYDQAAVAFLQGYRQYPESAKAPDSLLKLAMTLNQMGEKKEACLTFDEFLKKYPGAQPTILDRANRERAQAGCA